MPPEISTGEILESDPVTISTAIKEGWYTKPGSKWVTMPSLMLTYRAAAFWQQYVLPREFPWDSSPRRRRTTSHTPTTRKSNPTNQKPNKKKLTALASQAAGISNKPEPALNLSPQNLLPNPQLNHKWHHSMISNEQQHSLEWFRARIGRITGSQVGLLMKSGRKDYFSDTAKAYIYLLAAERAMNPAILADDELFRGIPPTSRHHNQSYAMGNGTRGKRTATLRTAHRPTRYRSRVMPPPLNPTLRLKPRRFLHRQRNWRNGLPRNQMP